MLFSHSECQDPEGHSKCYQGNHSEASTVFPGHNVRLSCHSVHLGGNFMIVPLAAINTPALNCTSRFQTNRISESGNSIDNVQTNRISELENATNWTCCKHRLHWGNLKVNISGVPLHGPHKVAGRDPDLLLVLSKDDRVLHNLCICVFDRWEYQFWCPWALGFSKI